jgi:hypothetical protein
MQVKTILNRIQKYKSFVYGSVKLQKNTRIPVFEIESSCTHAQTVVQSAVAADIKGQAMIGYRDAGLSLSRCGDTRSFSAMPRAE